VDWADFVGVGDFGHAAADFFVVLVVRVLGPGIEAPFDGSEISLMRSASGLIGTAEVSFPILAGGGARATQDKGAARVSGPDSVSGPAVEADVIAQTACLCEDLAGVLF
jgi:hypothetical protein